MTTTNDNGGFVLLLGVQDELFQMCFGKKEEWPCELKSLPESCGQEELERMLKNPSSSPKSVVIQEVELAHWDSLKDYYNNRGGTIVFFGIEGVFTDPDFFNNTFGTNWRFSAYTKYEYEMTPVGTALLGDGITKQQYTKSNLLCVPKEDRILTPKAESFQEFCDDRYDDDDEEEDKEKIRTEYKTYCDRLGEQVPLAMHKGDGAGGAIVYLGFVNGDGNIPEIVRAICCGTKTKARGSE